MEKLNPANYRDWLKFFPSTFCPLGKNIWMLLGSKLVCLLRKKQYYTLLKRENNPKYTRFAPQAWAIFKYSAQVCCSGVGLSSGKMTHVS